MEINTRDYVVAHGAAPKGFGNWAFCKVHPDQPDYLDHVIWVRGTYGEAAKVARKTAKAEGVEVLYVCS